MENETQVKQLLELAEDCTKTTVDQLITNAAPRIQGAKESQVYRQQN